MVVLQKEKTVTGFILLGTSTSLHLKAFHPLVAEILYVICLVVVKFTFCGKKHKTKEGEFQFHQSGGRTHISIHGAILIAWEKS